MQWLSNNVNFAQKTNLQILNLFKSDKKSEIRNSPKSCHGDCKQQPFENWHWVIQIPLIPRNLKQAPTRFKTRWCNRTWNVLPCSTNRLRRLRKKWTQIPQGIFQILFVDARRPRLKSAILFPPPTLLLEACKIEARESGAAPHTSESLVFVWSWSVPSCTQAPRQFLRRAASVKHAQLTHLQRFSSPVYVGKAEERDVVKLKIQAIKSRLCE